MDNIINPQLTRYNTLTKEEKTLIINEFHNYIRKHTDWLAIMCQGCPDVYEGKDGCKAPKQWEVIYEWQAVSSRDERREIEDDLLEEEIEEVKIWRKNNIDKIMEKNWTENWNWKGVNIKVFNDAYKHVYETVRINKIFFHDMKNMIEMSHWFGKKL